MGVVKMPVVVGYHAEIRVRRGGEVVVLLVDCPDWESDEEILAGLGKVYGVGTVGEVVEILEGEGRVRVVPGEVGCEYSVGDRV